PDKVERKNFSLLKPTHHRSYSQAVRSNLPEGREGRYPMQEEKDRRKLEDRHPTTTHNREFVIIEEEPGTSKQGYLAPSFFRKDPIHERLKETRQIKIW
ncbi:Hypothetical predicted protein, partial [Pelobates cultripes]